MKFAFPFKMANQATEEFTSPSGEVVPPGSVYYDAGMTLRDYFAAKAMHQLLHGAVLPTPEDRAEWLPKLANISYEVADAMLKARDA